jgi:uncharacterized protein YhfF
MSIMQTTPGSTELEAILQLHHIPLPAGALRAGAFGDSDALSNELIELIRRGEKRATCSLLWSWEFDNETIPEVGDVEVVFTFAGRPALVCQAVKVDIVPFREVRADFAAAEGEGDRSLQYWRSEHWRFFESECNRIGRVPSQTMPLVCEWFEVLAVIQSDR